MTHTRRAIPVLVLAPLLALSAPPAAAQTAQEVIDEAVETYREQMEGVQNYTVVQHQETRPEDKQVTYFTRRDPGPEDGPVFSVQRVGEAGERTTSNPYDLFHVFRERGELRGTETVNGEESFVLHVEDVSAEDLPSGSMPDMGGGGMQSLTYYVDTDDHLLRRMVIAGGAQGQMGGQQGAGETTVTLDFLDYRNVDGVEYPHRIEFDVDSPMMEQMAQQMQQMQEAMADIPEEQREQMRAMMEERMGGGMLGGAMVVDEIRVNAGPPEGLGGG